MGFWPRVFGAVVCWFLTMLAIVAVVTKYTVCLPTHLGPRILVTTGYGAAIIVVIVGTLVFWLWIWARDYW